MHDNSAQARLHEILRVFQLLARYGLMHSPFACRQRRITAVSRTRATTTRRTIGGCLNENAPATTFLRPAECGLFHACLLRLRYSQIHCRALSASRRRALVSFRRSQRQPAHRLASAFDDRNLLAFRVQ